MCIQPEHICACDSCETARRNKIRAFTESWFATHIADEVSGVRETARPPVGRGARVRSITGKLRPIRVPTF